MYKSSRGEKQFVLVVNSLTQLKNPTYKLQEMLHDSLMVMAKEDAYN